MIYTNLFKPNKANKSKTVVYYLVESRRYKFNIIFDKKFTSILSAMVLGTFMIALVNLGIYFITTSSNARRLASLEAENNNYMSSLSQLEAQQSSYLAQKADADNIFNVSDKPTKWSSIIESIAEQLPYDTVLTSVTTTNGKDIGQEDSSTTTTPDNNQTNTPGNNVVDPNNPNANNNAVDPNNPNTNQNAKPNLDEQIAANESIIENNIIAITGKSLSMVNLSLFLDKLDKLDLFSKVEAVKAEREDDSDYYGFIIYAFLN